MTMENLIIGTAGHVDHGKTEIVKALTGRDTDRLAEEKQRGISIVLGFAPLELQEGLTVGVVDVPGHERFVKNMVSGAVGVDLALLVVAADEGVMPQTREHFEVLRLLGVGSGVVAITKIDLADEDLTDLVESEIRDLLKGSELESSPIVRTSVVTGQGIEELREALRRQASGVRRKEGLDFFRMPVDRAFTMSGIGTIVTGTVWSGEVRKGDSLVLEPGGRKIRVRAVQSFDRDLERAVHGQRAAVALHGVRVGDVHIGNQIITPGRLTVSNMLDISVELSALEGSRLKNRQRIRFHHAAAEIMARAVLLDTDEIESGGSGFVQLRLERQLVARRGDRFVLRSYSPMRVIGGGQVLDPAPAKAKRFRGDRIAFLRAMDGGTDRDVALAVAGRGGAAGITPEDLGRYGFSAGRSSSVLDVLVSDGELLEIGGNYLVMGIVNEKEEELFREVGRFAASNKLSWGIDRETLRERMGLGDGPLFDHLIERGREENRLFFKGGRIRTGGDEIELDGRERKILEGLAKIIRDARYEFPARSELLKVEPDEKRLSSFLRMLLEEGKIVRVLSYGYLDADHQVRLLEKVGQYFAERNEIAVGDFKELCGVSRKYAVPLLEYLDSEGYTKRLDNARVAGPKIGDAR
jgi:selenocysteine-specific elongation factor